MTTRELAKDITTFLDWFAFCPGWEHFADSEEEAIEAIAETLEDKETRDDYRDEIADALNDPPEVAEYIALGARILEALDGFEEAREVDPLLPQNELIAKLIGREIKGSRYVRRKMYKDGAAGILEYCDVFGYGEHFMSEKYYTRKDGSVQCVITLDIRQKYHAPAVTESRPVDEDDEVGGYEDNEAYNEAEALEGYYEIMSLRRERDEWDDLWDDRARDCGAVMW